MSKTYRIYCPHCQPLAINGVACHETGCPDQHQKWVKRGRGENRHVVPENEDSPSWLQPKRRGQ